MAFWKTDPLYQCILAESRDLWNALDPGNRPDLFRIEERDTPSRDRASEGGRIRNVWILDDSGPRLVTILRRENHDPGPRRGQFSRFGLVSFQIEPDRRHVHLICQLGPGIGGETMFVVKGTGDRLRLRALSASMSA